MGLLVLVTLIVVINDEQRDNNQIQIKNVYTDAPKLPRRNRLIGQCACAAQRACAAYCEASYIYHTTIYTIQRSTGVHKLAVLRFVRVSIPAVWIVRRQRASLIEFSTHIYIRAHVHPLRSTFARADDRVSSISCGDGASLWKAAI